MSTDYRQLEAFRDRLANAQYEEFIQSCAKELAARFLRKVIKRTPVGQYPEGSGKTGGTLRRNWSVDNADMVVEKKGNVYQITLTNNTEYASYVEYGHRQQPGRYVPAIGKRLKRAWVEGQFFMTISEKEIQDQADGIIEKKFENFLKEIMNG